MSFTVSYNIKAVDKFTKVGLQIAEVAEKIDKSMMKLKRSGINVNRSYGKLENTSNKLNTTSQSLSRNNTNLYKVFTKLDKRTDDVTQSKEKLISVEKRLAKQQKETAKAHRESISRMRKSGHFMSDVGGLALKASVPVLGLGIAAGKVAMDFETAMVEVQKVTDKAVSKQMEVRIRDMAKVIPVAQDALANMTADAARFGIRGVDNIESFTRAVAKMSIATDLTTDEAGVAFAKIEQLTGVSAKQTENLGSAINHLANNYATSSSEIVSAMLRSSAAASDFGLNATQIAGLSAQINAVSESAERAGTRMRTLFIELQNPKKVEKYAKAIGMSVKSFEALRKASPQAALMKLVEVIDQGGVAAGKLRKVAGGEAIQALSAMAKNIGNTKKAMIESKKAFIDNTSLQKEFSDASATTANKLALFKNKLTELAIKAGTTLLPMANKIIDKLGGIIDWFGKLDPATVETAMKIAFFALKAGLLLKVLGNINLGVASLSDMLPGVGTSAKGAAGGVRTLSSAMKSLNVYVLAVAAAYTAAKAAWDIWETKGQAKVDAREDARREQSHKRIHRKQLTRDELKQSIAKEKAFIKSLPTTDLAASFESPDKLFQTFHSNFSDKVMRPLDEYKEEKTAALSRIAMFEQEIRARDNSFTAGDRIEDRLAAYREEGIKTEKSEAEKQQKIKVEIDVKDRENVVANVSAKSDDTKLDLGGNFK